MKKILSTFSVAFFGLAIFLVAGLSARAQVIEQSEVYIQDLKLAKTDYKAGDIVTGTFTLWNAKNINVPNMYYTVYLMGDYKNTIPQTQYDSSRMNGPIFLSGNEKRTVSFSYLLPLSVSGNNLGIQVRAMLDTGTSMGWADAMINVTGGIGALTVANTDITVGAKIFNLQEGPTIYDKQNAVLNVILKNNTKISISVTPSVSIYKRSVAREKLSNFNEKLLSVAPNTESKISTALPTFNYTPEVYVGEISFLDANGIERAPKVEFRYIVGGDIVTINSVASDKTSVAKGDVLNVVLNYSGSPVDIITGKVSGTAGLDDFNIKVFNQNSALVADFSDKTDFNNGSSKSVSLTALKNALALKAEITVSKDGKILASYNSNLSSDYAKKVGQRDMRDYFSLKIILAVIVLLLALLILIFMRKLFEKRILFVILLIILAGLAVAFLFADKIQAVTIDSSTTWGDGTIYNVFVNNPAGTLTCGQSYYLQVSASAQACSNRAMNFCLNSNGQSVCVNRGQYNTDTMSLSAASVGPFTARTTSGADSISFGLTLDNFDHSNGASMTAHQDFNVSCPPPVISGSCGTANGVAVGSIPTTNLCSLGATSTVSGNGPWTWTCAGLGGGTTASCSAPTTPVAVSCTVSPASAKVGDPFTWTANATGGNGTYTYNWNGDASPGTVSSVSKIYTTAGAKSATVTVISNGISVTSSTCGNGGGGGGGGGGSGSYVLAVPPHCTNTIQDADETGVDCGGADCAQCQQTRTLNTSIIGSGNIKSNVGGINCASSTPNGQTGTCSAVYGLNANVLLSASTSLAYLFDGWTDSTCISVGENPICLVHMFENKNVIAKFIPVNRLGNCNISEVGNNAVNKSIKWTADTLPFTCGSSDNCIFKWTGTDLSSIPNTNSFNKIYTTVGTKEVGVVVKKIVNGVTQMSSCGTSANITLTGDVVEQ